MVNSSDPKGLQEKIEELLNDEAYVTSLLEMEEPEIVKQALEEKDIDLTVVEILQIRDGIIRAANHGGELSEDDLAEVAGGCIGCVVAIVCAVACGVGTAVGITANHTRW